jgi:voltage-gated potassium channel Kch
VDRVVVTVALATVLLVTGATAYFGHALGLDWLDSLYFVWTTVLTVGYGDITPRHASAGAKLAAMALMLAGAALVAVFYALLAGFVVSRRLAVVRGHVPVFGRGHLIVAGAGHVGVRVAERLLDAGHRAVVIERDQDSPHIQQLRARGCHVIVADASAAETLDLAAVDRASAVLALTDSDATNLRVVLASRARRPDLPVIARLASSDLSAHVSRRQDAIALSSVDLASEAFARAALGSHSRTTSPSP